MEAIFDTAEKKVLVELVKLAQKRKMRGNRGHWKEFLNSYDKKIGDSISDPSRRTHDVLAAFLKTFDKQEDLEFLAEELQKSHAHHNLLEQFKGKSLDDESPEERLVRLTLQHPKYPLEYSFPSSDKDWVVTKLHKRSKKKGSTDMIAIDCEMVLCEDGTVAVVRVCAVDRNLEVRLNEFVKPNKTVVDYRTDITGITAEDLVKTTCSLADIQKSMKKLLPHGTILVGHGLHNDLRALKIDHKPIIDTSLIYTISDGYIKRTPSLNDLCKHVLGYALRQAGEPHNCVDDALASMRLVLAMMENGVDSTFSIFEKASGADMAKLLLHRIPVNVPHEELIKAIPGKFKIEVKPFKNSVQVDKYSALAIFENPDEADRAFEGVKGREEKVDVAMKLNFEKLDEDLHGLPQKLTTFALKAGAAVSFYVRKMGHSGELSSKKRVFEFTENGNEPKRLKGDQRIEGEKEDLKEVDQKQLREDHLKEIERLKRALRQSQSECEEHKKDIENLKKEVSSRDFAISNMHTIISNLTDKLAKKNT